jgi:hypothetical protein
MFLGGSRERTMGRCKHMMILNFQSFLLQSTLDCTTTLELNLSIIKENLREWDGSGREGEVGPEKVRIYPVL